MEDVLLSVKAGKSRRYTPSIANPSECYPTATSRVSNSAVVFFCGAQIGRKHYLISEGAILLPATTEKRSILHMAAKRTTELKMPIAHTSSHMVLECVLDPTIWKLA